MKAYSYIRWSSDPQTKGDSLQRQLERTRNVCRERKWELDESIKPDMGVSAYTGRNLAKGSLAKFIQAVRNGKIQTPCVLCVEGLDRLTRIRVRDARAMFEELLSLNVLICTAHNNKLYDETSLDNPMDLMISIMELNAGHLYAAELGKKISAAWTRKKEAAAKGELLTSRLPGWLLLDEKTGKIRIDKAKAKIIQRIFKSYLDGQGARLISLALNKEGIKPFGHGKGWSSITIRRFLTSLSVIGALQPQKYVSRTKRIPQGAIIENYYPAIIEKAIFYKVQERITERRTTKGARKHCFNLFSGLIVCQKCGWKVVLKTGAVVKEGNKKPHVRLVCSKAWRGQGCKYKTMHYELVERGVVTLLSGKLMTQSQNSEATTSDASKLEGELRDAQFKIARINEMFLSADVLPKTLVQTLAELEATEQKLRAEIAIQPETKSSLNIKGWQQIPNTLDSRVFVQGMMSDEIKIISLNTFKQTANVSLRNGEEWKLEWGEKSEYGFLLNDRWQPYLDDILFWKGLRNIDVSRKNLVHRIQSEGAPITFGDKPNFGQPVDQRVIFP